MNCKKCGGRLKIGTAKDVDSSDGFDLYLSYERCIECDTIEFFKERVVYHSTAKGKKLLGGKG